ncbi:6-aminohexanoate-dimer hydrolase [Cutibacterium acnes JCM 18918]|nr:6-aminohexanoate-dimer hydrolase [Cutibacterium acnes JCM 18918]
METMTDSVLDVTADALEQAGAHPHRLVVRQHGQVVGRRRWLHGAPTSRVWSTPARKHSPQLPSASP